MMSWSRTIYMLPEAARTRQCQLCTLAALYEANASNGTCLRTLFICAQHALTFTQYRNLNYPTKPPTVFPIPEGTPMSVCRTCTAMIRWITTASGKAMPLNLDGTAHFISCPFAGQHRKPAK